MASEICSPFPKISFPRKRRYSSRSAAGPDASGALLPFFFSFSSKKSTEKEAVAGLPAEAVKLALTGEAGRLLKLAGFLDNVNTCQV